MGYTLADDEVALILRPIHFTADGEWSGLISTGLAWPRTKDRQRYTN